MRASHRYACLAGLFVLAAGCRETTNPSERLSVTISGPTSENGRPGSSSQGPTHECGPIVLQARASQGGAGSRTEWLGAWSEIWDVAGTTKRSTTEEWARTLTVHFWRAEGLGPEQIVDSREYVMTLDQPSQVKLGFIYTSAGVVDTARFTFTCL
jgi:hypothetical protein